MLLYFGDIKNGNKKVVNIVSNLIVDVFLLSDNAFSNNLTKNEIIDYFNEIAFKSEYGSSDKKCTKWTKNVKIFISGKCPAYIDKELNKIISEINNLTKPIKLLRVNSKRSSNYTIYFGSRRNYAQIEPKSKPYLKDNLGYFYIYWNNGGEIYKGSMYVDTTRVKNKKAQKHLLREELTQSLGLMNDSFKYPDSMFYQKWTYTTKYSKIDKNFI